MKRAIRLARYLRVAAPLAALAALLLAIAPAGQAHDAATQSDELRLGVLATLDPVSLFAADDPLLNDPANGDPATTSPPYLPPGGKFKLFGAAKDDLDPENAFNEVFSFDTINPAAIAGAIKLFGDHVKIDMLDDQVELKYYYVGRTCGGGSTRFQLGIDQDGDGKFDHNAFGYVGDKPFGGLCAANVWVYEDMTNTVPKWDLSQFAPHSNPFCTGGNPFICSWQQMELFLDTVWPNHRVLNEVLVDDSGSFFPADRGCAYFDLVSAGARTFSRHDDTSNSGDAPNAC